MPVLLRIRPLKNGLPKARLPDRPLTVTVFFHYNIINRMTISEMRCPADPADENKTIVE